MSEGESKNNSNKIKPTQTLKDFTSVMNTIRNIRKESNW